MDSPIWFMFWRLGSGVGVARCQGVGVKAASGVEGWWVGNGVLKVGMGKGLTSGEQWFCIQREQQDSARNAAAHARE